MFMRTNSQRATDTPAASKRKGRALSLIASAGLCAFGTAAWADEHPVYETVVKAESNAFASSKDEAASAAVITKDRTPRSGETVEQLVAELPGTAVTRMGGIGAMSSLSIRGSSPAQVQVYVDDIPLNLATGGGVDLGFVPVAGTRQLELFKGSSPISFGSSGIGGILAVATETPTHNALTGSIGAGSWGAKNAAVSGSYVLPHIRAYASVSTLAWDGGFRYRSNEGLALTSDETTILSRTNNDLTQQNALLRLVFPLGSERTLSAVASLDQREQGVPGSGLVTTQETRLALGRMTAQLAYESFGELGSGSGIRANAYVLKIASGFDDPLGELGSPRSTDDSTFAVGSTARAWKSFGPALRIRSILDLRHEEYQPRDARKTIPSGPPGTRDYVAIGAEPSYWFSKTLTEVTPSARLEVSRDVLSVRHMFTDEPSATAPKTSFLPVTRLSLTQGLAKHVSFRANAGRYVRAPSTSERYGNTGFVLPNPTLKPERGTNIDAGIRVSADLKGTRLQGDAAGFVSWADDLIQFVRNSQGQSRAYNVSSARIVGAEVAIKADSRYCRLFAQVTRTHAINTSGTPSLEGKQLALRPRTHAYGRPEVTLSLPANFKLGIYGDANLTEGTYLDSTNLLPIPTRLLFGAGVNLLHKDSGVRAVVSANNLGNVFAYDFLGFPLPGRAIFLTLDWVSPLPSNSNTSPSRGAS